MKNKLGRPKKMDNKYTLLFSFNDKLEYEIDYMSQLSGYSRNGIARLAVQYLFHNINDGDEMTDELIDEIDEIRKTIKNNNKF